MPNPPAPPVSEFLDYFPALIAVALLAVVMICAVWLTPVGAPFPRYLRAPMRGTANSWFNRILLSTTAMGAIVACALVASLVMKYVMTCRSLVGVH